MLAIVLAGVVAATAPAAAAPSGHEWTRFGVDAARTNASAAGTGISVASLSSLRRQQVALPGTADSSAVYASGVTVGTAKHDVFIVTTTYGRTVAIDAGSGQTLWTFTPPELLGLGRDGADHDRHAADRRDRRRRLRRLARWPGTRAAARERPRDEGLARHRDARPDPREDRLRAQPLARPPARHHGRLHRRCAALPGPRRHDPRRHGTHRARLELALQRPAQPARPAHVRGQRLRDLGSRRCGRRARLGTPARRHRQRALGRQAELGRQRARALAGREPAAAELHAVEPGAAQQLRCRPRQRLSGAAARWARPAGRQGRDVPPALARAPERTRPQARAPRGRAAGRAHARRAASS